MKQKSAACERILVLFLARIFVPLPRTFEFKFNAEKVAFKNSASFKYFRMIYSILVFTEVIFYMKRKTQLFVIR